MAGLYIHIPFCRRKCGYCDFVSGEDLNGIDRYLSAIEKEAQIRKGLYKRFETVYIGGGTPSILNEKQIEKLFSILNRNFSFPSDAELTFEANPESLTAGKARTLKSLGVNRISLGLQSFDEKNLSYLGRLAREEDFHRAFGFLEKAGFENLSADLIYGLPHSSHKTWREDLKKAAGMGFSHISCYCLELHPHTPLGLKNEKIDEKKQEKMFFSALEFLKKSGYEHYEISNFARKGFRCSHNMNYWLRGDYLGLGISAASCSGSLRTVNEKELGKYFELISKSRPPSSFCEKLSKIQVYREKMMLALRLRDGIEYDGDIFIKFKDKAEKALKDGFLEKTGGKVRIKEKFLFVSNSVISDIIF